MDRPCGLEVKFLATDSEVLCELVPEKNCADEVQQQL
jgi:hypothetical protein